MKEIGLKLKEQREANGVSIEEAASDLKMRPSQLESIETGNKDDFKDILSLKLFIRDYAKYLGLDGEKILDEFNEYLFEQTSKISLEDIEQAKKEKEEKEKDLKILSPYTITKEDKTKRKILIAVIITLILIVIIAYLIITKNNNNDFIESKVSYEVGGTYEYSE